MNPVMVPPGVGDVVHEARGNRIGDDGENHRDSRRELLQRGHGDGAGCEDDIGGERYQFRGNFARNLDIAHAEAIVDPHIAADVPPQFPQALRERCNAVGGFRIAGGPIDHRTDAPHPLGLLCKGRQRPRDGRRADKADEFAQAHEVPQAPPGGKVSADVTLAHTASGPRRASRYRQIFPPCPMADIAGNVYDFAPWTL
jgi:hypothetical protein